MKTMKILICLLLATFVPRFAFADLVGPYTPDTNTLYLFHFDEAAGGSVITNLGSKGGLAYPFDSGYRCEWRQTLRPGHMLKRAGGKSGGSDGLNVLRCK